MCSGDKLRAKSLLANSKQSQLYPQVQYCKMMRLRAQPNRPTATQIMRASSIWVIVLAVVATLVCESLGGKWGMRVTEDPDHPNQCKDPETGSYYAINATWRGDAKCAGLKCSAGDEIGFLTITGTTCSYATKLPSNCHMTPEKAGVPFPDCCPALECDGEPNGPIAMVG